MHARSEDVGGEDGHVGPRRAWPWGAARVARLLAARTRSAAAHSPSARSHRRPSAGRVIGCPDFGEKSRVHAFRFSITPPRRCACGRRGAGAIWMLDSSTVQQCPRLAPTSHDRRSHTCTHASDDATQSQTRSHTHSPSPCPWYRCTLPRPLPLDPLPRAIALPLCLCVDTRPVPSTPSLKDILCHLR